MKARTLFIIAALMFIGTLFARGHAHSIAVAQAKAIVASDMNGQPVAAPVGKLKKYVSSHSGSGVTFSLVGSYNRDTAAAKAAAARGAGSGAVYAQAQATCAGRADSIQQAKCVQSYLATHLTAESTAAPVSAPDPRNYIHVLKSPVLAADLATLLTLVGLAAAAKGAFRLVKNK